MLVSSFDVFGPVASILPALDFGLIRLSRVMEKPLPLSRGFCYKSVLI